jgi:hypothetical protein
MFLDSWALDQLATVMIIGMGDITELLFSAANRATAAR